MLKVENNGDGARKWGRFCDTCRSAACSVYCRVDMAYLCSSCDARIHDAADVLVSSHERVWVCEACECAPAALLCKVDSASLCTSYDSDIHSANPLARRHRRVPILPISGLRLMAQMGEEEESLDEEDEDEAASWLLPNPIKINNRSEIINQPLIDNNGSLLGDDAYIDQQLEDNYNDHHEFNFNDIQLHQYMNCINPPPGGGASDSVVPFKEKSHFYQLGFEAWNKVEFSSSLSPKVDVVGVVPQSSNWRAPKGTIDLFSGPPPPPAAQLLTPILDREARVLRYREKKKARKFEKTIRYASRKAYAETRPRIRGRFAKRRDIVNEVMVDAAQIIFSTSVINAETHHDQFGMVPSIF